MSYRWTEEDTRRALGWYASGLGYVEIGARLGRTASAVEVMLRKKNATKSTRGYFAGQQGWTPADKERLARLWEAGVAHDRICKILGRSAGAVSTMATVMELGRRPKIDAREDNQQPTGDPLRADTEPDEALLVVPRSTYAAIRDAAQREGLSMARWLTMIARVME